MNVAILFAFSRRSLVNFVTLYRIILVTKGILSKAGPRYFKWYNYLMILIFEYFISNKTFFYIRYFHLHIRSSLRIVNRQD